MYVLESKGPLNVEPFPYSIFVKIKMLYFDHGEAFHLDVAVIWMIDVRMVLPTVAVCGPMCIRFFFKKKVFNWSTVICALIGLYS